LSNKLLVLNKVTKIFSTGLIFSRIKIPAVANVSFELERSQPEIFTLVGESGSGKTTLANLILRVMNPTDGKIYFLGEELRNLKRNELTQRIQPIFQNPYEAFNPLKRVDTYLQITAKKHKIASKKKEIEKIVEESLNSVGLTISEVKDRYPHEFSGGQLQRLSIARALLVNPLLLVADEPVSMLDISLRVSILNLLKQLKEGKDLHIIYITHDLATSYYISDRIAIMLRGNIVEMGAAEEVLNNPYHPYSKLLKKAVPSLELQKGTYKFPKKIKAVLEEEEYIARGCKFASRCPEAREICKEKEPEDFFVDGRVIKCWLFEKNLTS